MKIDLNKAFKKSKSVEMPSLTMAMQLSSYLLISNAPENAIKFYHWSEKLEEKGFIDIDEADRKTLYAFIEKLNTGTGVKAQLLLELDKAKEEIKP